MTASLIDRAGALSPGKTYKLMLALHKHALNYLDQLWMLASDRRHAKDVARYRPDGRAQGRLVPCAEAAGEEP